MNIKIISAILVLALVPLASLACGITVDLPDRARVGPAGCSLGFGSTPTSFRPLSARK